MDHNKAAKLTEEFLSDLIPLYEPVFEIAKNVSHA